LPGPHFLETAEKGGFATVDVVFMYFSVLARFAAPPIEGPCACLHIDNWDDYGYKTLYSLVVVDGNGIHHRIGGVKIGQFAMDAGAPPQ